MQPRRKRFFNIGGTKEEIQRLRAKIAANVFNEYDLWCLETYRFLSDIMLFRLCKYLKGPSLYVVDPQMSNRFINLYDGTLDTDNIVKRRKELGADTNWSSRLQRGQTVVLLFNYPSMLHWLSVHITVSNDDGPYLLRFYNSMKLPLTKRKKHALTITGLLHLMGCNVTHRTVQDVTNIHKACLQQRPGRNLCAIHCAMRVWLASTEQDGDDVVVNTALVDHVREYCLLAVFNEDEKVCHEYTDEECHANDFIIHGD